MSQLAVIFDVDGVLVDSYQAHFLSWQQLFRDLGVEYSELEFVAGFGRTSREILQARFGDQLSNERLREVDQRKEELYRAAFRKNFVPIEGAVELVDALAADGFLLAIGSSGPSANVELAVELLGLVDRFQVRVTGADVERGKPDPQVFELGAARLGVPAAACAVIEDAIHGITAANRAGMASIGLTGTVGRNELAHAMLVVERMTELTPARIRALVDPRSAN